METNAQMPVVKDRRQLDGALFLLTHGFAEAMGGVAELLSPAPDYEAGRPRWIRPLAELAPEPEREGETAQDPPHDPRPEAEGIFTPAFVDVPAEVKARARSERRVLPISDVRAAWHRCDWGHMAYLPLVGGEATLARKGDFLAALPHLGTDRVAYHAGENFVCREYGFLGAVVVAAELWVNSGIVCDSAGHHLYCQTPVWSPANPYYDGTPHVVEVVVWEPQACAVVEHVDVARHYTGKTGFALLI